MRIHVQAPATTANLGPGFDVAAAAVELWNELVVEKGDGPSDQDHLAVRAFRRFASPRGLSFRFVDRIPRERGLGSSAAVVALGLVAGAAAAGEELTADELLAEGLPLEGHADNLAAALAGGVCLTWDGRITRIADDLPAAAVAVIPETHVRTADARASLPREVAHADAVFSTVRATMLGAAIARGDAGMFGASNDDRLHEPYRGAHAPHLQEIRNDLPPGAIGATLSGSGPTVIVWCDKPRATEVASALHARYPEHDVVHLPVSSRGAGPA